MPNIIVTIMIGIMGLIGGASSLYILISLPVVVIWKCIRMTKGYKFTD